MLLLHKNTLLTLTVLCALVLLNACGLSAIHAKNNTLNPALASVQITHVNADRTGHKLKAKLEDLLNPTGKNTEKRYGLSVDITTRKNPLAIEQDAEITRYNLEFVATLRLTDNATGSVVLSEKSKITGSFQTVDSDFATYTVEQDTLNRLINESAETIRIRLSSFFLNKQQ